MKLKFKKQKIASFHLTQKTKGKGIYGEPVYTAPIGVGITRPYTEQIDCTLSLHQDRCQTNDGTLKTWQGQANIGTESLGQVYCGRTVITC